MVRSNYSYFTGGAYQLWVILFNNYCIGCASFSSLHGRNLRGLGKEEFGCARAQGVYEKGQN